MNARQLKVLIPMRSFHDGKKRLDGILSPEQRYALNEGMFHQLLHSLRESEASSGWIFDLYVLSGDSNVHTIAHSYACTIIEDNPVIHGHGNQLRAAATQFESASPLAVFMSDLPRIDAAALLRFFCLTHQSDVVLCPDRHARGINAAYYRNADFRSLAFGHEDSFPRHLSALPRGAGLRILRAPGLSCDLDDAQDLAMLEGMAKLQGEDFALSRFFDGSQA